MILHSMDRAASQGDTAHDDEAGGGEVQTIQTRRRRRRVARRPPSEAEVARMVAEYHARGGAVTLCPPACVLPIRNGDGLGAPLRRDDWHRSMRSGPSS